MWKNQGRKHLNQMNKIKETMYRRGSWIQHNWKKISPKSEPFHFDPMLGL
jgi:hypothetical protein